MAGPSQTLQRPDLGVAFEEFSLEAAAAGFIGLQVFPIFQAGRQSGNFSIVPIEQLLRDADTTRAPGGAYPRDRFTFETLPYATFDHGTEEPIDDRERAIYSHYLGIDQVVAKRNTAKVLRNHEKRVADIAFSTSSITSTAAVSNEWDDFGAATPREDILTAKNTFRANCGRYPNAMVINARVFENLKLCDEVIELLKYNGIDDPKPENITSRALAAALGIPRLIVAGSSNMRNTADEGQAASLSDIWSAEYALLCVVAQTDDLKEVCIGRTMHWGEDGSSVGATMEMYRDESCRSDIVRSRMETDELLIYSAAGHLISNVTTL